MEDRTKISDGCTQQAQSSDEDTQNNTAPTPRFSKAPAPIQPVRGGGYIARPKPLEVLTDFPPCFHADLVIPAAAIISDCAQEFVDRSKVREFCRKVVTELTPFVCDAIAGAKVRPKVARYSMIELLRFLLIHNASDYDQSPLKQEILRSAEWNSFEKALVQLEAPFQKSVAEQKGIKSAIGKARTTIAQAEKDLQDDIAGWNEKCRNVDDGSPEFVPYADSLIKALGEWRCEIEYAIDEAVRELFVLYRDNGAEPDSALARAKQAAEDALKEDLRIESAIERIRKKFGYISTPCDEGFNLERSCRRIDREMQRRLSTVVVQGAASVSELSDSEQEQEVLNEVVAVRNETQSVVPTSTDKGAFTPERKLDWCGSANPPRYIDHDGKRYGRVGTDTRFFEEAELTDKQREVIELSLCYSMPDTVIASYLNKHRSTVGELREAANRRFQGLGKRRKAQKKDPEY